jgi:hypothetical protein
MKKTPVSKSRRKATDDLRSEYRFDYSTAQANRFAGRVDKNRLVVVLDPDIAQVFTTQESVNKVLRALIENLPQAPKAKRTKRVPA